MNRRARVTAVAALLAGAGLAAAPQTPQQQTPTFKLEVNYVEVDVLVTDQQGNFVRDLKQDDFQVFEDGRPQKISAFSVVDLPVERAERPLGAAQPIEPDVRSNERPFNGRIYVMVIDDLHTLFGRTDRVKRAAREFIEQHLGANDLMAVVHTAGPTDASQDFTNNKRLLLAAVDRTDGRKLRSATLGKTEEYFNRQGTPEASDPLNDPDDAQRGYDARSTLETLKSVANWFAGVRGRRKSILFVSEGIDYDITDVFSNPHASSVIDETRDVIAAANRADVSIFGIDPRGLTSLGDEDIEVQQYPDDTTLGVSANSLQNEVRLSQDSLRALSDETGGFATVNRNDFRTAYDRIVRDNSTYYVLAYYPPGDKRDGKFHKIEVRVTRPGLVVRARKGYVSPKGKAAPATGTSASAEIRDAINSPLPVSGLTIRVFAAPFKGVAPNASVLLGAELLGRDLKLTASDKIDLSYTAIDAEGKVRAGNTDQITMNLRPETKARVEQSGIRLLNRVNLPPGRYQLRFAARDAGGALGAVHYDLEVPDFAKADLAMSGLVLTSPSAAAEPTARPDEQLRGVLPGPPAAARTFSQRDELATFAEVYDNRVSTPHKVDIRTTVTSDDARVVFKNDEERASSELGGKPGGYGTTARIPLKDLAPGKYVLKVEAQSRLGGAPVSRELQFTVEAAR
ncbi:MAG: VWA domain-containing protein [Betaproteobacteria bacterium]